MKPKKPNTPIRIFVGSDRSQKLALRVLEFSILKHTNSPIEFRSMEDLQLPNATDPAHRARTGFSFARFAIPELCDFSGRAIYLDADMLVFDDIHNLWSLELSGASLACQEDLPDFIAENNPNMPVKRKKQCSVMVLDCDRLDWNVHHIIGALGSSYSYEELMQQLIILDEHQVSYGIPTQWNSLEHYDERTSLIHYTDMMQQPWVCAHNRNGELWTHALREMINAGQMSMADLEAEIEQGFVRPSLILELARDGTARLTDAEIATLQEHDTNMGFRPHEGLQDRPSIASRLKSKAKVFVLGLKK